MQYNHERICEVFLSFLPGFAVDVAFVGASNPDDFGSNGTAFVGPLMVTTSDNGVTGNQIEYARQRAREQFSDVVIVVGPVSCGMEVIDGMHTVFVGRFTLYTRHAMRAA